MFPSSSSLKALQWVYQRARPGAHRCRDNIALGGLSPGPSLYRWGTWWAEELRTCPRPPSEPGRVSASSCGCFCSLVLPSAPTGGGNHARPTWVSWLSVPTTVRSPSKQQGDEDLLWDWGEMRGPPEAPEVQATLTLLTLPWHTSLTCPEAGYLGAACGPGQGKPYEWPCTLPRSGVGQT